MTERPGAPAAAPAAAPGKLLVFGALGVVGRAAWQHLAGRAGWQVVGTSRRTPPGAAAANWVSLDLRDGAATRAALAPHRDATHVVYAALNEQPVLTRGWRDAGNMALNTTMLRHALDALDGAPLRHLTLLQGTKAYGVHTGRPMPVPAREHQAQRDHTNFYFDQQDLVEARAARNGFAWTAWRPQIVLGQAVGSAMNPVLALGVLALLQREQGQPMRFPGHPHLLTECTDARLIAQAIEWSWTAPAAHGRAFNITNGDVVLWRPAFERVAAHFGVPVAEPPPGPGPRLADAMPPLAPLWRRIAEREGLVEPDLAALMGLSWQYADATFAAPRPLPVPPLVSTIALRQAGFGACIDTEDCIVQHLQALQAQRVLSR